MSTTPAKTLASTGGNSGQLIAFGVSGAVLLAIGADVLTASRRRAARH
ncbi:hypothetical protein [Streptomyces sp. NPDC002671]